jgi:hypothetical protein
LQGDRRQLHCNDKSTQTAFGEQPCDQNKRFAIFVREVDCSGAPDCGALHREPCFNTTATCGRCLHSFEGEPVDSNSACTQASSEMDLDPITVVDVDSCAAVLQREPTSQSGVFQLRSGKTVLCNMQIDGGGWTSIFVGGGDNLHYIDPEFASHPSETMLGFVDSSGAFVDTSYVRFTLPTKWQRRPPMTYANERAVVTVTLHDDTVQTGTLVYGYTNFDDSCDFNFMESSVPSTYKGRICFKGLEGTPWWNNFVSGEWGDTLSSSPASTAHCISQPPPDADGDVPPPPPPPNLWDSVQCSTDRRFAIFVRHVSCASSPDCKALNRHSCHGTPNTCGICANGYKGISGDSNEPCVADCSQTKSSLCSGLHRAGCDNSVGGVPHTCGKCGLI